MDKRFSSRLLMEIRTRPASTHRRTRSPRVPLRAQCMHKQCTGVCCGPRGQIQIFAANILAPTRKRLKRREQPTYSSTSRELSVHFASAATIFVVVIVMQVQALAFVKVLSARACMRAVRSVHNHTIVRMDSYRVSPTPRCLPLVFAQFP